MKLYIKGIKNYVVQLKRVSGRRSIVTVLELKGNELTGRNWAERHDPVLGTVKELSRRFDAQITNTPVVKVRDEPDAEAEKLRLNFELAVLPMVSATVHDTLNRVRARMQALAMNTAAEPEQVILEGVMKKFSQKLERRLPPLLNGLAEAIREKPSKIKRLIRFPRLRRKANA